MDINFLRSLSPVFVMIAFAGVCWWAYSPSRRKQFDEAANLPFADEPQDAGSNPSAAKPVEKG
ncbi:MAG TPA: cbb3-type cytochrome c oxidase subunit 3 [Cellvibrionaceae bacterium]|nr:cbb3-type cytochrome c oxidase subunit 3 [Cellvibrionaceae bacterium]